MADVQHTMNTDQKAICLGNIAVSEWLRPCATDDAGSRPELDQACAELTGLRAASPAAQRAKATALLAHMDLTDSGEIVGDNSCDRLAYSLARDVLGGDFEATLKQLYPPYDELASAAPKEKLDKLRLLSRPHGAVWLRERVLELHKVKRIGELSEAVTDKLLAELEAAA